MNSYCQAGGLGQPCRWPISSHELRQIPPVASYIDVSKTKVYLLQVLNDFVMYNRQVYPL